MKKQRKIFSSAYIVTVDMGYGHQRAVHPLRDIANGDIITANNYPGIPNHDRHVWRGGQQMYERISRLKRVPLFGNIVFGAMDYVQRIEPFYPRRDLSAPNLQLKEIYHLIKKGWGRDLINTLNKNPLPFVTSFFTTAFFAEEHGYKGDIYAICTDTDISRAWAPLVPSKTRIVYLAPNRRVKERLELYGIPQKNILITGFPLPKENIGTNLDILKNDLAARICRLDKSQKYRKKYSHTLEYVFGGNFCPARRAAATYTITFAVGGAGAQRELGVDIASSLRRQIMDGAVRLNLVAGTRNDVCVYFKEQIVALGLEKRLGKSINIISADNKMEYFTRFNRALRATDILWTKPSELSFYAGLGLPVIMAPTVGSQEEYNKSWLLSVGAGFEQEDPRYTNEWLFDWIDSGWLAEASMNGFLNAPRNGTYHIENIVLRGKKSEIEDVHLL